MMHQNFPALQQSIVNEVREFRLYDPDKLGAEEEKTTPLDCMLSSSDSFKSFPDSTNQQNQMADNQEQDANAGRPHILDCQLTPANFMDLFSHPQQ